MKSLLGGLMLLGTLQVARAEEIPATPESAVVELRILRREIAAVDAKYKPRVENFGKGVCSGSFIDQNGDILTAGHCAANAISIEVVTSDNNTYQAVILATSAVHDLALLHIDRSNTPYFKLANKVTRGEQVFILGSPLAISNTLSTGIVAKLDGDITLLDCGALPGNSGSAVYNAKGEAIGVLTAGYMVGMGTTHLNMAQSLDAIRYFLYRAFKGIRQ